MHMCVPACSCVHRAHCRITTTLLPKMGESTSYSSFSISLLPVLQLFLDDAKVKNFITCFKDQKFLVFFFTRLRKNQSGRYEDAFPFISLCGREHNFVRCDDLPVVFTHLLEDGPGSTRLSYGGAGEALAVPFEPARLMPLPANGRLYHPAPKPAGGVGLVRSSLAFELSSCFQYPPGGATLPTHILWQGQKYPLTMDLASLFPKSCGP
ncbi:UPF0598 protein C8orf82 homolog isoform X2 [Antechinus flavipes]|uniref:UPF0598 protein C8orf82 homolog isoform X2 n=1 Tax=Antechinus flavipes TaxID=38775 RepID=UPI0022366A81|nr:UPF0598 protein C8orf82 homolog isoform X2 [Antechinus flavipes]